jgi:ribosomal protein S18 acetylase RimI-like enzyme
MNCDDIEIQIGLPDDLRVPAACIYYDAFCQKLRPICRSREDAIAALLESFDSRQAILALRGCRLVGVAGIQHQQRPFMTHRLPWFVDRFGWLEGRIRYGLVRLDVRPYSAGELLMDGLAVDKDLRGQGIGSLLLGAVIDFARTHGYETVRLDVVNTNVKARRLYERTGFAATVTHYYPYLLPFVGFWAVTTMIYTIQPVAAAAGTANP